MLVHHEVPRSRLGLLPVIKKRLCENGCVNYSVLATSAATTTTTTTTTTRNVPKRLSKKKK